MRYTRTIPVSAEDVFYYCYAVLNAEAYEIEFESVLHREFPRIPFTASAELFSHMAAKGKRLVELQTLEARDIQGLANIRVAFHGLGNNVVGKDYPKYDEGQGRVLINSDQYFAPITREMWEYCVGSYRPLEEWIEDRRGRSLTAEDRRRYDTIATSIQKSFQEYQEIAAIWQNIRAGDFTNPLV